ncbi:hypothetical protein Acr_00g0055010 [Actinidia rufa]|uniref:Uncharacterized protein n=1 Tax=Actinidia rufa TaxID=165716 RepID=A0A7J0DLS2_9ERIC|nr:hypothetical protein Acr_00g0055010 [Actinidia rufa]
MFPVKDTIKAVLCCLRCRFNNLCSYPRVRLWGHVLLYGHVTNLLEYHQLLVNPSILLGNSSRGATDVGKTLATSPQNNLALMNFWSPSILLFEPPRLQSTSPDPRIRILCIAVPLHPNLFSEISAYNNNIAIPMMADFSPHGILLRSLQDHMDTLPKLSCPEISSEYPHPDLHSPAI